MINIFRLRHVLETKMQEQIEAQAAIHDPLRRLNFRNPTLNSPTMETPLRRRERTASIVRADGATRIQALLRGQQGRAEAGTHQMFTFPSLHSPSYDACAGDTQVIRCILRSYDSYAWHTMHTRLIRRSYDSYASHTHIIRFIRRSYARLTRLIRTPYGSYAGHTIHTRLIRTPYDSYASRTQVIRFIRR